MRSFLLAGMLLFAFARSAKAQDNPKGEVAGNYTYIHINPGGFSTVTIDCHGGGGSAAWSLNHYLAVVGEFSGCKWTGFSGVSAHTFTYLFGPRLTYRAYSRLEPFGEVLLGGAHIRGTTIGFNSSGSDTAFAVAIGGGADYKWKPSVAIRFIQADYLYSRLGGTTQNNLRLQAGVVFRFGDR
jgi:opacity protein-like surface antigen